MFPGLLIGQINLLTKCFLAMIALQSCSFKKGARSCLTCFSLLGACELSNFNLSEPFDCNLPKDISPKRYGQNELSLQCS